MQAPITALNLRDTTACAYHHCWRLLQPTHTPPLQVGTTAVDLGAQWIHGREGNPVYADIVVPQAMRCVDTPYNPSTVFQQSGNSWAKMSSSQVDAMDARYEQLATYIGRQQNSNTDVSLLQTINNFVSSRSPAWSSAQKQQLNFSVTGEIEHEYAADVGQLSTWWWDESLDSGDTDCVLPEGFSQVGGVVWVGEWVGYVVGWGHLTELRRARGCSAAQGQPAGQLHY